MKYSLTPQGRPVRWFPTTERALINALRESEKRWQALCAIPLRKRLQWGCMVEVEAPAQREALPLPSPNAIIEGMKATPDNATKLVGKTGQLIVSPTAGTRAERDGDLLVTVRIVEAKYAFGRIDVRVTPIQGRGKQWVTLERLVGVK